MFKQLLITLFLVSTTALVFGQKTISPDEFYSMVTDNADAQLIDVRTAGEFDGGHLAGAVNMDFRSADFAENISALDKTQPVYVYCLSGGRSASASRKLASMGYKEVYDMQGGIMSWKRGGLPVESAAAPSGSMSRAGYDKLTRSDLPVLVDFYATWCGPCKKMAPMLEDLKKQYEGKFTLVEIDADKNDPLLKELDVNEIPTFYLYKNGKQTWQHVGLVEKETLLKELGL